MATDDDELDTSGLDAAPGPSRGERAVKWLRYVAIGGVVLLGVAFIIWLLRQRSAVNTSVTVPTSAPSDGVTPAPADTPTTSGPIPVPTVPDIPLPTVPTTTPDVPTPPVAPAPAPVSATSAHPAARTFTVRPWPQAGSSLSSIAGLEYNNPALWPKIYAANRAQIGSNPDLIKPGMVLTIPA